jgi:hypothetical protein
LEEEEDKEEEEEEEEEGAYSSASPIPWVDLADEEEPSGGDASLGGPFPLRIRGDAPSELTEAGHFIPSEPSEQREGLKQPCTNEA